MAEETLEQGGADAGRAKRPPPTIDLEATDVTTTPAGSAGVVVTSVASRSMVGGGRLARPASAPPCSSVSSAIALGSLFNAQFQRIRPALLRHSAGQRTGAPHPSFVGGLPS